MVKVIQEGPTGVALTSNSGNWIVAPINSVAWQINVDHNINKDEVHEVIKILWEKTGALKLFAMIPAEFEDVLAVVKSAGFKQEGRMKAACEIGDLIIVGRMR